MRIKNIPIRTIQPQEPEAHTFNSFKIRSLCEILLGKDLIQDPHRHDFYFILVVSKGHGHHVIDFVEHPIKNNSVFILRPGQVHQLHLNADSEGYLMEFDKEFQFASSSATGNELLRKSTSRNFCKLDETGISSLCSNLQSMLEEYRSKENGFEGVIKANLHIFLIKYLRHRQKGYGESEKVNLYQQEKLQEFLDLLETNIGAVKSVSAYADLVSLSPFQLNAITKSLLGKTVAELIEGQILLEARRYLLATANQVNQIAFQLGYEDVSYFIRLFKKLSGYTPEAYRKNFR